MFLSFDNAEDTQRYVTARATRNLLAGFGPFPLVGNGGPNNCATSLFLHTENGGGGRLPRAITTFAPTLIGLLIAPRGCAYLPPSPSWIIAMPEPGDQERIAELIEMMQKLIEAADLSDVEPICSSLGFCCRNYRRDPAWIFLRS
jgi:hypothetical protein